MVVGGTWPAQSVPLNGLTRPVGHARLDGGWQCARTRPILCVIDRYQLPVPSRRRYARQRVQRNYNNMPRSDYSALSSSLFSLKENFNRPSHLGIHERTLLTLLRSRRLFNLVGPPPQTRSNRVHISLSRSSLIRKMTNILFLHFSEYLELPLQLIQQCSLAMATGKTSLMVKKANVLTKQTI